MKYRRFPFIIFFFFFGYASAFADLSIVSDSVRFEPATALIGKAVTVYLSVHNSAAQDERGILKAYNEKEARFVGADQAVAVIAGQDDHVFLEFTPKMSGEQVIAFRIIPWDETTDNPDNNKISKTLFVDEDTDADGQGNRVDEDDDNDGTLDAEDLFPLDAAEWADTDGDGVGNNADDDDDNDGVPDIKDALPLDSKEAEDRDQDGIGDNADPDDDGDGIADELEAGRGLDPQKFDSDGDGVGDGDDDYPLDRSKTLDTDKDGAPNEDDPDDDGDGIRDARDAFPVDATESADSDNDGKGNNADADDDNDGRSDEEEILMGADPLDVDSDNDGVPDGEDEVPLDPADSRDSDHDELGDSADPDDDNPGPIVRVAISSEKVQKGETVYFDASKSYDPDGGRLAFLWTLPNGEMRHDARVGYVFDRSGKRKMELQVTDGEGESRTRVLTVEVASARGDKFLWGFLALLLILPFFTVKKPPALPQAPPVAPKPPAAHPPKQR